MREGSSPKKGQQRMTDSIIELHTQVPADLEGNVFGQFDEHLKLIERTLNVTLISRDGNAQDSGYRWKHNSGEEADRGTGNACGQGKHHHPAECDICTIPCDGSEKSGTYRDR